jgi:PAS domain S-box-containing protein
MTKAVGRDPAEKKKSRKIAETKKTAGKRSSTEPAIRRAFDLDALLDSMGGMVFVASPDYRIEYMNEEARKKIGRDMTGRHCFTVIHGLKERCPWCMGELVLQGQTVRQEIQNPLDKRWYSSVLTPLHRNGSVAIQALVFDITDQKQAQAALVQSEALLRSIHQAAPMGIGVVHDRVLDWTNEQLSRMTGYAADELRGKSARMFYPDDEEFDRVGRHKYEEIRSKGTGSIVTVWRRKDGRLIHVYLSSTPIDPGDLSVGVVFTALDITEKKKAQDELWKSEEKYRALFENAVMGIFQSTPEGCFLSVNPATAKMCGYSSPEEMAAGVTDIATQHYVDPAERELFIRAIEGQGFVRNFEHRTYRKDGSVFWVSVNARAVRDGQGKITHYEGTHEDIQWRREAEEKLRQSEGKYRHIFDNTLVGVFQSSSQGRYMSVNPAFARIYGYETPEDVISSITDIATQIFVDAEDRKRCMAILQETGVLERFETQTRRKDGSIIWTVINSHLVRDTDGRPVFIEGVLEDITERKLAEKALRASEERFFKVFQSNPTPMTIATIDDGRLIYVNERAIELSGYSREEMIGRSSIDIGLWAYPHERDQLIARLREMGSLRDGPAHFKTRTGDVKAALWSADVIRLDGKEVILTTIHDITEQVEAQEKMKQSEGKYRLLAENVTDVIWTADLNLKFTYVSPSSERVFGWSPSEWLSFRLQDVLTPGSLERAMRALQQERERLLLPDADESLVTTVELEVYRKDGSSGWFEVSSRPLRDCDGKPTSFIGVTRDISQRKEAEEALRKNEALLKSFLEAAPIGIGVVHSRVFSWVNEGLLSMTGYSLDELSGKSARLFYTSDSEYERVGREKYAQIAHAGKGVVETRWKAKDGRLIDIYLSSSPIDAGDLGAGVVFTAMDISGLKRAEAALRASEEFHRLLFETCPMGIALCSPDGKFLGANKAYQDMTGYTRDDLRDRTFMDLTPATWHAMEAENIRLLESEGSRTYEKEYQRRDGAVFPVSLTTWVMKDSQGAVERLGAFVRDISEQDRAEAARKELEGQLRQAQKMEAIGTLAGGIAHDFNNILFTIVGFTDLSLHDASDGETRWNLTQVLNACDRAKNLVNQILAFSRQEAPERRPVDIVPIAKDALKFLRSTIPSTVELKQRIMGGNLTVLSDPTTIHQVLINLGTNAAHAMRTTGGVMEVCLESLEIPRDRGRNVPADLKPGPYIRMAVRDTGLGIDPAIMNRIFDPFFTTKAQGEGTGLGLSVVYGIIKSHGGSIAIESAVGRGSTFHVYLPRTPEAEREDDRKKAPASGGSEHILFVDDEVVLVDMGERMLNALGYRVTAVSNGAEALATFRENPGDFDLVITDMTMPGMTGAELSREILKIKPGFPIILCTGFSEIISEGEAKAMGIRRFLMKPVFLDTLAGEIRTVLDTSRREVTQCPAS